LRQDLRDSLQIGDRPNRLPIEGLDHVARLRTRTLRRRAGSAPANHDSYTGIVLYAQSERGRGAIPLGDLCEPALVESDDHLVACGNDWHAKLAATALHLLGRHRIN